MNIGEWLAQAEERLKSAGIPTSRLDALVLLEDGLFRERAHLLAHPEKEIPADYLADMNDNLSQRERHVPLAYIRGKTEFYGRLFFIDETVLEPRPESETMIDLLKDLASQEPVRKVADMGSGSGALGITAAVELELEQVYFYDIGPMTLHVARMNAGLHKVNGTFIEGDLFAGAATAYDAVLANLPYVPDNFQINTAALHEPRLAIFGGPDGLDVYRRLFEQASALSVPPRYILTEALPPQHPLLRTVASDHGYEEMREEDFIQVFRIAR